MSECRATVVLQRAKHRIGIDLIAGASETTGAIVITDIVALRGNRAAVKDISAGGSSFQDCVPDLECRR